MPICYLNVNDNHRQEDILVETKLSVIKDFLESFDLQVGLYKVDEEHSLEEVLVSIGQDLAQRSYFLQIRRFDKDMKQYVGEEMSPDPENGFSSLNFFMGVPFEFPEEKRDQICRLASIVNKMLPFQTFGVSEQEKHIYCQYNYPFVTEEIHENILLGIISSFIFAKDTFVQFFDDVATEKATVDSLIQEADKYMQKQE